AGAVGGGLLVARHAGAGASGAHVSGARVPVLFVSHGSPLLALDPDRAAKFPAWGAQLPKPSGILVMTPPYASPRLGLGTTGPGFAMYSFRAWLNRRLPQNLEYPSPPSAELALRVEAAIGGAHPTSRSTNRRGLDHTTWMPLLHLFPKADVPVLEL